MKKTFNILSLGLLLLTGISSCKQKDNDAPAAGKTYLEFFSTAGGVNAKMDGTWYRNENKDSFTITKFNYYISNIRLNGNNGQSYTEENSYHLIEQSKPASMAFNMNNVPAGQYNSITFTIGVDSLRNVSGAQDGALSTDNGMFWNWNSGYIMLKFEGTSPSSPQANGQLMMHSGGFSGANSVLKTITLNFPNAIEVKDGMTPHVHLTADILALFKSPNRIDFATMNTIHMPGADAKKFADNYAGMFSITYAGY